MLFPSSATQTQIPAPSRSARESCWEHRDIYFACLDKSNIAIPGEETKVGGAAKGQAEREDHCRKEREVYGKECAASWVSLTYLCSGTAQGGGEDRRVRGGGSERRGSGGRSGFCHSPPASNRALRRHAPSHVLSPLIRRSSIISDRPPTPFRKDASSQRTTHTAYERTLMRYDM